MYNHTCINSSPGELVGFFMRQIYLQLAFFIIFSALILSGCVMPAQPSDSQKLVSTRYLEWQLTLTPSQSTIKDPVTTQTPVPMVLDSSIPTESLAEKKVKVFLHPGLSDKFLLSLNLGGENISLVDDEQNADIRFQIGRLDSEDVGMSSVLWIYALVAPFYTLTDGISSEDLAALWQGNIQDDFPFSRILVTPKSYAVMQALFGPPDDAVVEVVTQEELNSYAQTDQPFLSLLPFEELDAHWKVLRIDDQAPIDDYFSPETYLLSTAIWVEGIWEDALATLPDSNFDRDQRTVLIMTGVTALTRATAYRMDIHGNPYPGLDIHSWLSAADLVHISNEVSFAQNCPDPDPFQPDLIFCSAPERIELLEYVSADIIELSGNHVLDYGIPAMNLTLEMYEQRNWAVFAGGWDLADARSPALITHNGNRLAFLGCNPVGPPIAWATESKPGAVPCGDFQWMIDEIQALRAEGYLPIVTLQYFEDYTAYPSLKMQTDFRQLANAGAVMVSGSQAHTPKNMIFADSAFIHYGLGNLFFDQMEVYYNDRLMSGTREAFIDRLIFYKGQLISVELLTTMLEDYARPRPMTPIEREALLSRIFRIAIDSYE
jgi:poly-gamma-glutamate synthesis protein (capsule biosynthesis protein)